LAAMPRRRRQAKSGCKNSGDQPDEETDFANWFLAKELAKFQSRQNSRNLWLFATRSDLVASARGHEVVTILSRAEFVESSKNALRAFEERYRTYVN